MSVNVVYCEGNAKSYDIRVIRQLLPKCELRPLGGKGFIEKIIADRAINPNLAGLFDRDFDYYDFTPSNTPLPCNYEGIHVGWKWERKEIENYLIDPIIVQRALGNKAPSIDNYKAALNQSASSIATYTAARIALSCFKFKNFWGDEIKQVFGSSYSFPKRLNKEACEQNIRNIVQDFKGDRLVTPENVLDKFEELLPSFLPGGKRFENYLIFFAGKDLLWQMKTQLEEFGFESNDPKITSPIPVFLEKVVSRLERSEEVWKWLPEWQALRELIINTDFYSSSD
ncbi:hypothetical protein PCC7424_1605 [Gloeothece citriformis PCC 7424]|uniref:DUF4435 domain-containing protein n=1 Tax=Gloeothece citriformis (strain PCC 7424) TaxID=65393 RepID=B7K9S6_GLOC7|nr:hypothetical protein [Gloeothece citriformis]ACK70044.1 hypothetical protein PCC7424_1605 [Gloeothece citriformis PCC 7424]